MLFGRGGDQERKRRLAERLASTDAEVRAAAAQEIARVRDHAWAVRELARALDREPTPETFNAIAEPFADALCRDRASRQRVERMFAEHVDDPAALVWEWTALMAEYGAGVPVTSVGDDLAEDVRGRLERLREQGWRPHELGRMRPGSVPYAVAFGAAVELLHEAVLRASPLSPEDSERTRAEARYAFERALAHPPESEERGDILMELCERPEDTSWADRARAGVRVAEAIAWCRSTQPERAALGAEALECMLLFNDEVRRPAVRATLDFLCARQPLTLATVLRCYTMLQNTRPLDDPPVDRFLDALAHPSPRVRAAAASGLDAFGGGSPQEARVVAALIDTVNQDPSLPVVRAAASSLALIVCRDEANTAAASAALATKADARDPGVRAASVEGALFREEPGGFARLTAELRRPDVEPVFLGVTDFICGPADCYVPDGVRAELIGLLESLDRGGWADRPVEDDLYPDPEDRAELLAQVLDTLRAGND
ncbi:HEAT repeat domain-containing protein [Streptomyces sp. NPDC054829]